MFKILKSFGSVQSPYRKVDDVEYDNNEDDQMGDESGEENDNKTEDLKNKKTDGKQIQHEVKFAWNDESNNNTDPIALGGSGWTYRSSEALALAAIKPVDSDFYCQTALQEQSYSFTTTANNYRFYVR